jgi:uncharacterized protein YkwD
METNRWMGLKWAALVVALGVVAACEGAPPAPDGTPPARPTAATSARPGPGTAKPERPTTDPSAGAATCGLPDFQAAALARINRARAAGADCRSAGRFAPARPLVWNDRLALAASAHSHDMSRRDLFSHTGSDGRNVSQRATAVGYPWASIGENIEAGYAGVNDAVAGWMDSDHHCANIMEPRFTEMALACVKGGPDNTYTTYWTLDLGRRR